MSSMSNMGDMSSMSGISEIARIRAQIEQECEALRLALNGYAAVASHSIIERKYDSLGKRREELEKHLEPEEAGKIVCEIYTRVIG